MSRENLVQEFHEAFDHPVNGEWDRFLLTLRSTLIGEETVELLTEFYRLRHTEQSEWTTEMKTSLLKEMADLQYVLSGAAVSLGLNLEEAFKRVHESNMSKLGEDGKPIRREDGKTLKGPNYKEPYLDDLV
jgi:predicted HAD superfamily Cof-like phosphohydrolase